MWCRREDLRNPTDQPKTLIRKGAPAGEVESMHASHQVAGGVCTTKPLLKILGGSDWQPERISCMDYMPA